MTQALEVAVIERAGSELDSGPDLTEWLTAAVHVENTLRQSRAYSCAAGRDDQAAAAVPLPESGGRAFFLDRQRVRGADGGPAARLHCNQARRGDAVSAAPVQGFGGCRWRRRPATDDARARSEVRCARW